jgi:hypothetical protein
LRLFPSFSNQKLAGADCCFPLSIFFFCSDLLSAELCNQQQLDEIKKSQRKSMRMSVSHGKIKGRERSCLHRTFVRRLLNSSDGGSRALQIDLGFQSFLFKLA